MAKVLIYGASGGIGSTLARALAREGHDLHQGAFAGGGEILR